MLMKFLELKLPPPVVALLLAVAVFYGPRLSIRLEEMTSLYVAVALAMVGFCFDVPALVLFLRRKTTISPLSPHKSSALVTTGIYKVTRNPMYVGLGFLLLGLGVYAQNGLVVIWVGFFVLYITKFQIRPEERVLLDKFGEEYKAYCSRVSRWL